MTTYNPSPAATPGVDPPSRYRGAVPAVIMLLGTLVSLYGLTWDIFWHIGVGVDSFWTAPHLFVYSGAAITGITSLFMVLAITGAQRRGLDPDPSVGGRQFRTLGVFAAPLGYLVGGISSAGFLLYGLFDEWWHGLYGFDVTIASPPHQGWLHSVSMTMVGTAIVFAAARQHWWGRLGAVLSLVMYGIYAGIATSGLDEMLRGFGVQWQIVTGVLLPILCIVLASQFLGWRGAVMASGLTVVVNTVMIGGGLWAVGVYADSLVLSLREGTQLAFTIDQVWVPLGAALVGVVLALLQYWRPLPGWALGLYTAIASLLVVGWVLLMPASGGGGGGMGGGGAEETNLVVTLAVLSALSLVVGWASWRWGRALRAAGTVPVASLTATEATA